MSVEVLRQMILPGLMQSLCRLCHSKWESPLRRLCTGHSGNIHSIGCLTQVTERQLCRANCTNELKIRRFYVSGRNCPVELCSENMSSMCWHNRRQFHISSLDCSSRAKNTKRKIVKPLTVKKKGLTSTLSSAVQIQTMMTVEQIAKAIDRDTDHVFEVLLYIEGGDRYEKETSVIDNLDILKKIVKMSGLKCTVVSQFKKKKVKENKDVVRQPAPDPSVLVKRPPVVTIMGHVDHGKTTLLDSLRDSNVVAQEFGGITQHIGAFLVTLSSGESITFLDTPGHAAFSAMRARGAQVTDIIVLVLAADDGVMQQTIESIELAKNAGVPIVVAINKIDKTGADVERTKKMLLEHNIVLEEFGGEVQSVPISALHGKNLIELQETIVTLAELSDLKADPVGLVEGRVIEAKTDPGRGKLVTAVIHRGTLKKGSYLVAGTCWAKVRCIFNDNGQPIQEAPPSTPVEIIGWKELPSAGDEILQVQSEQEMKEVIEWRKQQVAALKIDETQKQIEEKRAEHQQVYQKQLKKRHALGQRFARPKPKTKEVIDQHEGPSLSLILKGDVDGSVEAILDTLDTYNSKKCRLNLIHYGVGNITEGDIELAEAFKGEIYGFNVNAGSSMINLARSRNVPVKLHKVIYRLFDDLTESLSARLPKMEEEKIMGRAKILQVFQITDGKKMIPVAGCRCVNGILKRKMKFKLLRNDEVIYTGTLDSLKHLKNEVETIKTDVECGLSFSDKSIEFQSGDVVVCFALTEVEQDIDWEPSF